METGRTAAAGLPGTGPSSRRIVMALSSSQADAPLADHLATSHWILIHEGPYLALVVPYDARSDASVADALRAVDATDVVALELESEACRLLQAAGIAVWEGEPGVPGSELAARVLRGALPRLRAPACRDPR